jgi:flagellar hook protein FlgE
MSSTTAIFTGLSGLKANASSIDVIGNNVANVNTTAYKSSRVLFSTTMSRTYSDGTSPSQALGGTNPKQIGNGVNIAGTQRNFSSGVPSSTGDGRDLAIEGSGFFLVRSGQETFYTRAGSFRPNAIHQLVNISGERVQGYGVDQNYNIVPGKLVDLEAPVGELKVAQATTTVRFAGNLKASGTLPTRGTAIALGSAIGVGFRTIAGANPPAPDLLLPTTTLVSIEDPAQPGTNVPLMSAGQSIQIRGVDKGGKSVPVSSLNITATTTVADLMTFYAQALGIDSTVGANPDGSTPGVTLDIQSTDVRLLSNTGDFLKAPFVSNKTGAADGESIRTTFAAFDSLGTEVDIDVTLVLDGRDSNGTRWRYFVESPDDTDIATQLATGILRFDNDGQPINPAPTLINVDRAGTGAGTPLPISLDFFSGERGLTSLAAERSEIVATFRDGAAVGTLVGYSISSEGLLTGTFSNGLSRTLGQVAVATFNNPEGLEEVGNNLFRAAPNSGTALVTEPGSFGTGSLVPGALESSNVDLGDEFTKMILASTGYSASSRVIKTADELLQQLLVLGR